MATAQDALNNTREESTYELLESLKQKGYILEDE